MVWCGMVWYAIIVWYGILVWYGGDIMLGDDNAAAKWESPASRGWSPDGQILFLGYRILSLDDNYYEKLILV